MSAGASVHLVICWDFKWGLGATNQLASDLSHARFLAPFLQLLSLAVNFCLFHLAGIGDVLSKRLEERGFDKAYVVLGQFLVLKKDEDLFREWLKDTCGANAKQSRDCFGCLREWCDAFL